VAFILVPLLLDESLKLCKELFDRVEIRRIRRQIQQLDASFTAQLFYPLTVMERCIVYDKDRVLLRIWPAMVEKLVDKVFEHSPISRSLEDF
jgi:hypothetical protein